jgi:glucose-1-phosphate cytidylyltransferase
LGQSLLRAYSIYLGLSVKGKYERRRGLIKVIILAGGLGTRMDQETESKPKPMILLGEKPILWHIMNSYALQGFKEFVIATGYKSEVIDEWVENLDELWDVTPLFTGIETQTGGRIKQVIEYYGPGNYLATYGDGLGNIDIKMLLDFHFKHRKIVTLTAVRPPARFGYLDLEGNKVTRFGEKSQVDVGWINGGFFVLDSKVTSYIENLNEPLESGAFLRLTDQGELMAFLHEGFWLPMDTRSERSILEIYAEQTPPPWLKQ